MGLLASDASRTRGQGREGEIEEAEERNTCQRKDYGRSRSHPEEIRQPGKNAANRRSEGRRIDRPQARLRSVTIRISRSTMRLNGVRVAPTDFAYQRLLVLRAGLLPSGLATGGSDQMRTNLSPSAVRTWCPSGVRAKCA